ncbi:MAG: ABC transporter permease subunit [Pseudomonadota bacterium]
MTVLESTTTQSKPSLPDGFAPWLIVGLFSVVCFALVGQFPWIEAYPTELVVPIIDWINLVTKAFVDNFRWLFRALSWTLDWPMTWANAVLAWLPWPATMALMGVIAFRAGGWKLVAFTTASLGYMVVVGYWDESMATLSLVAVSVPLSVGLGLVIGILAFRSPKLDKVIQPTLDLMQTIPAFAYLIPILFLFGFGPVVGLIASAIYSAPPMVRNTILGLRQVPPEVLESADMSGCTPRQRFWQVEIPTALPQIMIGVNQTTMAALSMVIIAAIIGGFADIGWEVLSTMRKAQFGQSLLAGLVIALLAMMLDRISWGLAEKQGALPDATATTLWRKHLYLITAFALLVFFVLTAQVFPWIKTYPDAWVFYPAEILNSGVKYILGNYADVMTWIKTKTLFYLMLPLRIGFVKTISPFSWGFQLESWMIALYALAVGLFSVYAWRRWSWRASVAVVIFGGLLFYGTTGTPWPVFMAVVTLVAWQAGGRNIAALALGSMIFILINGIWMPAMLSIYLCTAAVLICVFVGGLLGVLAAQNDGVSAFLRPINDTLQTMPQFVLLIPALMLFKVGEFTALLAIIAYAIVPMIRYVEHGLRQVPPDIIEASRQMGCTNRQLLFEVKFPLALPVIMLGLNQTIMFGLAMLVIAALVGTQGLGQQVYLALGKANAGAGVVTGLSMALIAITADRIIQAISRRRQEALGL